MINCLESIPEASVVVLHACCHNPTGVDLSSEQWDQVLGIVKDRKLIPFVDFAYQGFGDSVEADGEIITKMIASNIRFLIANSFSKSFSLYGERVGGLSLITKDKEEAEKTLSQVKKLARTTYSNPPTHGAKIVAMILSSNELSNIWGKELDGMRNRIKAMRSSLKDEITKHAPKSNFRHIVCQRGMFSYTGLTKEEVVMLREKFSVYAVESGRICVAALNNANLPQVGKAIAAVI